MKGLDRLRWDVSVWREKKKRQNQSIKADVETNVKRKNEQCTPNKIMIAVMTKSKRIKKKKEKAKNFVSQEEWWFTKNSVNNLDS